VVLYVLVCMLASCLSSTSNSDFGCRIIAHVCGHCIRVSEYVMCVLYRGTSVGNCSALDSVQVFPPKNL